MKSKMKRKVFDSNSTKVKNNSSGIGMKNSKKDNAQRKNMAVEEIERWLAPILSYERTEKVQIK